MWVGVDSGLRQWEARAHRSGGWGVLTQKGRYRVHVLDTIWLLKL